MEIEELKSDWGVRNQKHFVKEVPFPLNFGEGDRCSKERSISHKGKS